MTSREAPYPSDTRAKGWRFEIDHERIRQSDTWALAPADLRPWFLMLWMVAWEQTPCGSLPEDDTLIAARIGMPPKTFQRHRALLMRGWWRADDGRLYHDVLVLRVRHMLTKRAKDAKRTADYRAAISGESHDGSDGVTRDTPLIEREFDTRNQIPDTRTSNEEKASRKRVAPPACPDDVDAQVWGDWLALRKKKRAEVSATVIAEARREAGKAGMTFEAFLRVWCLRGSQGLQADWLKPSERGAVVPLNRQQAQEDRNRTVADEWARGQA